MADIVSELSDAVNTLVGAVAALDEAIQKEIAALQAAISTQPQPQPDISASLQKIADVSSKIAADTAALTASLPPTVVGVPATPSEPAPAAPAEGDPNATPST